MMKRLLFSALSALFAFSANADKEYVYTPQGRFEIISETDIMNGAGSFNGLDGWTVVTAGTSTLADNFAVGIDGSTAYAHSAVNTVNEGMKYTTADLDPDKTYVVSYKMRSTVESTIAPFTMLAPSASHQDGANVISITGDDGNENIVTYNAGTELTTDWVTYGFAIVGDGIGRTLTINLNSMETTLQIADMKIREAQKVADDRDAKIKADYVKAIYDLTDWTKFDSEVKQNYPAKNLIIAYGQVADITDAMRTVLGNYIDPSTIDAECPGFIDDVAGYAERVAKYTENLNAFLSANMLAFIDVTKNAPANEGDSYQHLGFNEGTTAHLQKKSSLGGWTVVSPAGRGFAERNNWANLGHYQGGSAGFEKGELKREFELYTGVYVFSAEMTAYVCLGTSSKNADTWNANMGLIAGDGYVYVTNAEGETVATSESEMVVLPTINGSGDANANNWGKVILPIKIEEDGNYTVHMVVKNRYPSATYGGVDVFRYPELYGQAFGEYTAAQKKYISDVKKQIAAMRTAYDKAIKYSTDTEDYYWYKQCVADTAEIYRPNLEFLEALTDADIIDGFNDPESMAAKEAAEAETGQEFPDWDYNLSYDKYAAGKQNAIDSLYNREVRPLLRLNDRFLAYNQVLFDMLAAIEQGKAALSDRMSAGKEGYATLQGVVESAELVFEDFKQDPGDAETLVNEYIPAAEDQTKSILEAIDNFNKSGYAPGNEPVVLRNFDFEDATAFKLDDAEGGPGRYEIAEGKGMTFTAFETETNGTRFANGWNDGSAWTSQGILRVGNAYGTIALGDEEIVSGSDGLHVSCDYYFGNLSGKECGIYLKDSEGGNVAGLVCIKYANAGASYNPFGINLNDFSAVGASNASNVAIAAEGNKTHFDFYLDYGLKTMYVIINNANQKTVNKRYDVAMDNQNPVASIVIYSNYNNGDRRSWVDNIVIEKIPLPAPSDFYHRTLAGLIKKANAYEAEIVEAYPDVAAELNAAILIADGVYKAPASTEDDCKKAAEDLQAALDKAKQATGIFGVAGEGAKMLDGKYLKAGKIIIIKGGRAFNAVGAIMK